MKRHSVNVYVPLGYILLWYSIVKLGHMPFYILPSPAAVFHAFIDNRSMIAEETWPTLFETLAGLMIGISFGCLVAIAMVFCRPLKIWVLPLLIISQAMPTFAIAPLIVIWLGYGVLSKIATCVIMIFFPIASALFDGLQQTKPEWLTLATTLQAEKWRVFWFIRIPAALPYLASGIRMAAVLAPIGAVIGEWVGASRGLGYLILNANARMQIDLMFAVLFVLMALSLLLYLIINTLLRILIPWLHNN